MNNQLVQNLHPVTLFIYFLSVLLVIMLSDNIILLLISALCGIILSMMLIGIKKSILMIAYSLPMSALIIVTNMLFVREGVTVLFWLGDWSVTAEAIIYGCVMAVMLTDVLIWCRCYSAVMTADKFSYIFGRIMPKVSLLLIMIMRFIPMLARRWRKVDDAQRALGVYATEGYFDRIAGRIRAFGILIEWGLEGGIVTADSMRARGYGVCRRTSCRRYELNMRGILLMVLTAAIGLIMVILIAIGAGHTDYYPAFGGVRTDIQSIALYLCAMAYMSAACIAETGEVIKWHWLQSKI